MRKMCFAVIAWMLSGSLFFSVATAQQAANPFSPEQLDQLLAPIALYPDQLLAQIFMASTYPLEVVQAARWVETRKGSPAEKILAEADKQPWDPSVRGLTAFPQVLSMMNAKLDWTQKLGDAVLAQQPDVMASVQRLRAQADAAGNLKSSPQITVVKETQTIVIQPANPQVIYVPQYNPTVVYGAWPYPAYPPTYIAPAPVPGYAVASGIAFGVGVAMTAAIWNNHYNHYPSWNSGSININNSGNININNSSNVNINRNASASTWQHNAAHRGGVAYRDTASQQKYSKNVAGAEARQQYRGRDATPQQMPARGNAPAGIAQQQPANRAAAGTPPGGARAQQRAPESARVHPTAQGGAAAQRDPGAFARAGNGAQAQRDFDRGRASQQSMASHRAPGGSAGGGARAAGGGGGGRAARR